MDAACLDFCLMEGERLEFEKNGFFIVEDLLPPQMVEDLTAVVDRLDAQYRAEVELGLHDRLHLQDSVGKDDCFLELLGGPKTFPKVWEILGWNIQLYLSHMDVTPSVAPDEEPAAKRLPWHQDSGRLNKDMETDPRPRISLKVAYFLSDTTEPGRGNFYVAPGSHLQNELTFPDDGVSDPGGSLAVQVRPGTAVFFDQRFWHAKSPNYLDITRKVLFYGYSYRWLRPRDKMMVSHFLDRCDPVRRQFLGVSNSGGLGYTSPKEEAVPLQSWIREHLGEEAVVP